MCRKVLLFDYNEEMRLMFVLEIKKLLPQRRGDAEKFTTRFLEIHFQKNIA
jgi:hypothetical protein